MGEWGGGEMRKEKKMTYLVQINNCWRCPRGMTDAGFWKVSVCSVAGAV